MPPPYPAPISKALMGPPLQVRSQARLRVQVPAVFSSYTSAHAPLGTFQPDPAMIQQKSDAKWREVCES